MTEDLLPKGGGVDKPSLDHRVLLHFLIKEGKANVPKYIFNHMIWALKESQNTNRSWIPYGRLLSEIFHQGGILKARQLSKKQEFWKGKTNSSGKSFLNRNYCYRSTRPLLKLS